MADNQHNTFTEANIARVIAGFSTYYTTDTVCTLSAHDNEPISAEVLVAFANLAKVLKLPVSTEYGNLKMQRRKPEAQIRTSAIERLQSMYERGEVDIDGNPQS